jgi:predicted CopG family antitoxin
MGTKGRRSGWAGIAVRGTVYKYLLRVKQKTGKSFSDIIEEAFRFKIAILKEKNNGKKTKMQDVR